MIERKYLAHYIDASFGSGTPSYGRLGKDLEEYNEELNPDVEVTKNIIGEQSVKHSGYEVQADVDPFYFEDYDDVLSEKIMELANTRATGDKCKTTMVDVLLTRLQLWSGHTGKMCMSSPILLAGIPAESRHHLRFIKPETG